MSVGKFVITTLFFIIAYNKYANVNANMDCPCGRIEVSSTIEKALHIAGISLGDLNISQSVALQMGDTMITITVDRIKPAKYITPL